MYLLTTFACWDGCFKYVYLLVFFLKKNHTYASFSFLFFFFSFDFFCVFFFFLMTVERMLENKRRKKNLPIFFLVRLLLCLSLPSLPLWFSLILSTVFLNRIFCICIFHCLPGEWLTDFHSSIYIYIYTNQFKHIMLLSNPSKLKQNVIYYYIYIKLISFDVRFPVSNLM